MGCPDENALSHFYGGLLPEEQRAEILAHVEGCPGCQRALAAAADTGTASEVSHEVSDGGATLARGSTLARYVVLERIGHGAMGVVYAAYDPQLDRQVALKLLRPRGRQLEELRRRLLREAQSLARLSHPNVVAVHDVGTAGDDVFLALELVEGTSLERWMAEPHPWSEVLRVFRDAGRGLAAAHAAGLVHRDFKPANVLLGKDGRARVTDFGLARPSNRVDLSAGGTAPRELSMGGAASQAGGRLLAGTPAYMSPEQLLGQGVDALSDQFSFCVALYEALFGARPFEGHGVDALTRNVSEGKVRPLPRDSKVPASVRRVVLRGLRARPEERFPSMDALLEALTPPSRRVRTWLAAAGVAVGLLGVPAGYVLSHRREVRCAQEADKLAAAWSPERRERVHAAFLATGASYAPVAWEKFSTALEARAAQWRELRTEACLATEGREADTAWQTAACLDTRLWQLAAVTGLLEKADAQAVQNAQQLLASLDGLAGCKEAPALFTRPQPPDALRPRVDEARRKLAEARARMDAGQYSEAIARTTALLKGIQGLDYRPLEAEVLLLHGQVHALAGKLKEAEEILYKALWASEAGRDDETVARVWSMLVWLVGDQQARASEVERIVQHAEAAVERLGRERFPAVAVDLHLRMGGMLLVQGKLEEADAEYAQGLVLSRKADAGVDSSRTAYFLSGLGRVRSRQNRPAEALEFYRQAQEVRERLWGPEHPAQALSLNNIAIELLALGRREEAIAAWRKALVLLEASRPPDHPSFAAPLINLATVLRSMGHLDEARKDLERALAISEKSKGRDHPNTASAINELGMVAFDSQRLDEARAYHQQALERVQRALGADTPRAAAPLNSLGIIDLREGRYPEARKALTRALQLWEKEGGPAGSLVTQALRPLAQLEVATGAPRKALEHCQRALAVDERVQGVNAPDVALDLACLAEGHLALGAPEQAVPLLERARKLHTSAPRDPLDEAWAVFLLARALGEQRSAPDRPRAAALAEEARGRMEGLGIRARGELKQVLAWQRRGEAP